MPFTLFGMGRERIVIAGFHSCPIPGRGVGGSPGKGLFRLFRRQHRRGEELASYLHSHTGAFRFRRMLQTLS